MKKRLPAFLFTCTAICSLTACSMSTAEQEALLVELEAEENAYSLTLIVKQTDEHFERVIAGAKAYAVECGDVVVTVQSPSSSTDFEGQINIIETVLEKSGVDALILAPLQAEAAEKRIRGTDKVIVAVDTDFDSDEKSTYVGATNEDAAFAAGQETIAEAIAQGAENPSAVIISGVEGDETHEAREKGYTDAVEEAGGEVLTICYCNSDADDAAEAMQELLETYPDGIDVVLGTTDEMILAAIETVEDSGNEAYDGTVYCGFNGDQDAIEAILEGTLDVTAAQNAYEMGYYAAESAVMVLKGEEVEAFIDSGSDVITAENAEEYIEYLEELGLWE